MTNQSKVLSAWLGGGIVALFAANLVIRILEARAPKPQYVSEQWLRDAAAGQSCYTGQ